ncbi:MAG: hypothetical protein KDH15_21630 [Rhodocyclaceae bacterium]|nr:hypothetical protein [Rhodocyclaceae bacterium]
MTIRVSVTHHEADAERALLADIYHVDPYGQVCDQPLRRMRIEPGVTDIIHLARGHVLVVREEPEDDEAGAVEAC